MKNFIPVFILILCFAACNNRGNNKEFSSFENAPVTISAEVIINDSVIDSDNVQAVIDPVWFSVDIYQSKEVYEKSLKPFTQNQRYILAIQWYMTEVNNGGHSQFFTNITGIVWKDALEGFKKTGLNDYYRNLQKATELFPGGPSFDQEERNAQLDKIKSDFASHDKRFYELDEKKPLEAQLIAFIKKNRKDFYFKGKVNKPLLPSSGK